MARYFIEDFIEESNACSSREQAFALYRKAIAEFGFTRAVYTFVTDIREAGQAAGHGVQCNFPSDWMGHYTQHNYEPVDPVILKVKQTNRAFTWRTLEQSRAINPLQQRILKEAHEAGLYDGVGVPLHGPCGEMAGTGLAGSSPNIRPTPAMLAKLQWITQQFHLVYCSLGADANAASSPQLTGREVEILQWLAVGKTDQEIALILNSNPQTVRWHLKNIYTKLEANSKTLAVTKAIRYGIITLDMIRVS